MHLCFKSIELLFGEGYKLSKYKDLSQPGQFACREIVTLEGPKGKLKLRVLGPARKETQVELSVSDAKRVGIKPDLRLSGDLTGTPGAVLIGSAGSVKLKSGVIVAARHLHISSEQANIFGLKDGDIIKLQSEGPRSVILENVAVRVGNEHDLELHIDFDEANSAMIENGDLLRIIDSKHTKEKDSSNEQICDINSAKQEKSLPDFITESDVIELGEDSDLLCSADAIITPLAKDRASQKNIRFRKL